MKKILALLFLASSAFAGSLQINQGGTGTAVIMQGTGGGGGSTPGGSSGQFQYNNGGSLAGSVALTTATAGGIAISTFTASSGTVAGYFYMGSAVTGGRGTWWDDSNKTLNLNGIDQYGNQTNVLSVTGYSNFNWKNTSYGIQYAVHVDAAGPSSGADAGETAAIYASANSYKGGLNRAIIAEATNGAVDNRAIEVLHGNVLLNPLTASQFVKTDASKNLVSDGLYNDTATWTAQQTFKNQITLSSSVVDGSGTVGSSGQFLQSQGAGAAPVWATAAGGGGSSTLAVQKNGVNVSSPTVAINFLGPPYLVTLVNGSTSQIGLDGSSVTMRGNGWASSVDTSTGAIWTQFGAVATSTAAIWTQFGAVATSTGAIITRANLAAAATAQVALDTTTIAGNVSTIQGYYSGGVLKVANGGTGTASPGLVAGTNITSITGTWPNQTINAATQGGSTPAIAYRSGTLGASWDGGGSALTTGTTYWVQISTFSNYVLDGMTLTGTPSGAVSVNVSSSTVFNTAAVNICGGVCPSFTTATSSSNYTMGGWQTTINAGGYLYFMLNTASTVTQANITLDFYKP